MLIFLQEIALQLFLWLLQLIDGLMEIFSAISGVTSVNYHGQQVNIIEFVIGDSTVGAIFWCIFITAVGLTCIFTIVGLVKNMVANNRTVSTIVGKFFLALLGTMAMLAVVILGILIANSLLQLLARIFQLENNTKLSTAIFNACVGDWVNGYSASNMDVTSLSVSKILGGYDTALFGIWPTSWKCNGMVNPNTFMYLPALIAGIALTIALIIAVLNLAKRVYEIVFTYFTMPISMSTLPLDDGARFKNWREMFVTKIVLAYGAVLAVNIRRAVQELARDVRDKNRACVWRGFSGQYLCSIVAAHQPDAHRRGKWICKLDVYAVYDRRRCNDNPRRSDIVCKTVRSGRRYESGWWLAQKCLLRRKNSQRIDIRSGDERSERYRPCRKTAQRSLA